MPMAVTLTPCDSRDSSRVCVVRSRVGPRQRPGTWDHSRTRENRDASRAVGPLSVTFVLLTALKRPDFCLIQVNKSDLTGAPK
jgi:hypothetical protein